MVVGLIMESKTVTLLLLTFVLSCGSSQKFVALPPDLDTSNVPHQVVEMTAENFHFAPEEIHVKAGTLLILRIAALGTHGFKLSEFGIDERLEDQQTTEIKLFVREKGTYDFQCSHFCGIGHFGMTGTIIVE